MFLAGNAIVSALDVAVQYALPLCETGVSQVPGSVYAQMAADMLALSSKQ